MNTLKKTLLLWKPWQRRIIFRMNRTRKKSPTGKININSADTEQLVKLKGIGEKMSERIIKYRQENGPFMSIEEIMKVSGISEKKFEDIKEYISVE